MDAITITHNDKLISPDIKQNGRYHYNFIHKLIFFSDDEDAYRIDVCFTQINYEITQEENLIHNITMQNKNRDHYYELVKSFLLAKNVTFFCFELPSMEEHCYLGLYVHKLFSFNEEHNAKWSCLFDGRTWIKEHGFKRWIREKPK